MSELHVTGKLHVADKNMELKMIDHNNTAASLIKSDDK